MNMEKLHTEPEAPEGTLEHMHQRAKEEDRKLQQRLEMVREGYNVTHNNLELHYVSEKTTPEGEIFITLQDVNSGGVVEVSLRELGGDDWSLAKQLRDQ